jgi:hypothetical protein
MKLSDIAATFMVVKLERRPQSMEGNIYAPGLNRSLHSVMVITNSPTEKHVFGAFGDASLWAKKCARDNPGEVYGVMVLFDAYAIEETPQLPPVSERSIWRQA